MQIRVFSFAAKFPVTITLIIVQTLIFLRPGPLDKLIPAWYETCPSTRLHTKARVHRHGGEGISMFKPNVKDTGAEFLLSTFFHVSSSHLLYDILTLLWSGAPLEKSMGSIRFASTICILGCLSQYVRLLAASWVGAFTFLSNTSKCAVGSSATFFALKVVLEKHFRNSSIPGLSVILHVTILVELLFVHALVPGTSFTGHLCGILTGYSYVYAYLILDTFLFLILVLGRFGFWIASSVIVLIGNLSSSQRRQLKKMPSSRQVNIQPPQSIISNVLENNEDVALVWQCQRCKEKNGVFFSYCEACGASRATSLEPSAPSWSSVDCS